MNTQQQTQTTAMSHRRNLAPPHQDPATSSLEPTIKKPPKSSTLLRQDLGPNIQSIFKPFRNFYSAQLNTVNNPKSSCFVPKPQIETSFQAKPISDSAIQDKPMSKSIHQSRRTTSEIEKQKIKPPIFLHKTQIETAFQAKPISVSSIQDKPMSKSIHQSRKSTLEIEKQKLRASVTRVSDKDPIFLPKSQIETSFEAKHIYASSIEGKPISKSSRSSRKTTVEIEKQKLRASINGHFDKPHDFKIDFLKKMPKEERAKEETIVSLSKSQDSGLKVAYRSELGDVKRPSFSLMTGGRRRSFCNSQAELADFLSCNGVKIVSVDMPPFMLIHAVDCARKTRDSLEKFTSKTLAFTLKKEFDGVYGPAWHCIVGSSFGSFVTHSVGGFMYFSMDHKIYILLFKTTVQRAD